MHILKLVYFIFLCFFISACHVQKSKYRECFYTKVDVKEVELEQQNKLLDKAKEVYSKFKGDYTELIYYSKDSGLKKGNAYIILALFDDQKFFIINLLEKEGIRKNDSYSINNKKVRKIIELSKKLPLKFYERDCLVEGGIDGVFYMKKSNKTTYYYKSLGYDINVADKDNLMEDSYPLYKELMKLAYIAPY